MRKDCVDVLVVGAGVSGLVAGLRALETGSGLAVEKGDRAGIQYLAHGEDRGASVWTFDSFDAARAEATKGNPALQRLVVNSFEAAMDWLESRGAQFSPMSVDLAGIGSEVDPDPSHGSVDDRH